MPRLWKRGRCEECGSKGRIYQFERTDGRGFLWLCGKCQQMLRHNRTIKRVSISPETDYRKMYPWLEKQERFRTEEVKENDPFD